MSAPARPSRPRRVAASLLGAVVALVGLGATPVAAAPPQGVLCSSLPRDPWGAVSNVRITGDLVADDKQGTGCYLNRVVVDGDVVTSTWFGATGTVVLGDVTTVDGGDVSLVDGSSVAGDVVLDNGAFSWRGLNLRESTVHGDVRGTAGTVTLYTDAVIVGDYDVATTDRLKLVRSTIWGHVETRGGRLLVHDSDVRGGLTSTGSGMLVCRSTVVGDLTVTHAHAYGRVGLEGQEACGTTVTGSVHVVDNPHSIDLGQLTVGGDLVCTGNTGPRAVTWTALTAVAGARTGQCA